MPRKDLVSQPLQCNRHGLDALPPQMGARLAGALSQWRRYDEGRQALMKAELQRLLDTPATSKDAYEIAKRSLGV